MILLVAIFALLFLVTLLCVGLGQAFLVSRQKQQVRTMLRRAESEAGKRRPDLLRPETVEDPLSKALNEIGLFSRLTLLIEQAGLEWSTGKFVLATCALGVIGLFAGFLVPAFSRLPVGPAILFSLGALIPPFVLFRKRAKRMAKFEEQFPEALNFLSRAMRAGHAFSIGLEMLVADSPEPLVSCFRRVLSDLHLGSPLEVALGKLVMLVPLIDVRFFVSSILLQQGTGGNLSEILDTMAHIIRERFRLKGQVKAASAHGRITGLVLAIMPVAVAILLLFISPAYLMVLVRDHTGRMMLFGAVIGQVVGYVCIRKIVNIKV
jgi:tight adherence protein B